MVKYFPVYSIRILYHAYYCVSVVQVIIIQLYITWTVSIQVLPGLRGISSAGGGLRFYRGLPITQPIGNVQQGARVRQDWSVLTQLVEVKLTVG